MNTDPRDPIDQLLGERFGSFEPSGEVPSWDSFEHRRSLRLRRMRVVTALCASAAAVVVGFLVAPVMHTVPFDMPQIELSALNLPTIPEPIEPQEQIATQESLPVRVRKAKELTSASAEPFDGDSSSVQSLPTEHIASDQPQRETPKSSTKWPSANNAVATYRARPKDKARWAVGLFANVGYSDVGKTGGRQDVMMGYSVGKYMGEMRFDARELRHDFPVSVGASVQIGLARNLNFETGLSYTYLRSTSKKEPEMSYRYTQTLHYIGIPLGVSYAFLSNRRVDLYATGGAMVEYAVGGEVLSEVYSNTGADLVSSSRSTIDTRGLMVSFNVAAGLNVNLTPTVGLYVEPGVSTYLDNDTHPVNFRTQSAVQFNLRAGIKVKL